MRGPARPLHGRLDLGQREQHRLHEQDKIGHLHHDLLGLVGQARPARHARTIYHDIQGVSDRLSRPRPSARPDPTSPFAAHGDQRHADAILDHPRPQPARRDRGPVLAAHRPQAAVQRPVARTGQAASAAAVTGGCQPVHSHRAAAPSRLWNKSAATRCGDRRPRKPAALPAVDHVGKGHGWLFPRTDRLWGTSRDPRSTLGSPR